MEYVFGCLRVVYIRGACNVFEEPVTMSTWLTVRKQVQEEANTTNNIVSINLWFVYGIVLPVLKQK